MSVKVNRRQTLGIISAAAAASCTPTANMKGADAALSNDVFRHGVASGDPQKDSVVLWTRIETNLDSEPVRWEIARDAAFTDIVRSGEAFAKASADHTVKAIPDGLDPGAHYFYRFTARKRISPVGQTRTLPEGATDRLGLAVASCSNYAFGFFNAYEAIAKDDDVDFVLHTGDYIYEYGADEWGAETAKVIGRVHEPANEIVSLLDYRTRHAQYKRDAGSLAMHAAKPLITLWDDHESANNPWVGGAQNHQPDKEGDWIVRCANAIRAYYEWMPIRNPALGELPEEYWRTYVFGDLATLVTLESRHTARGEQVDYARYQTLLETDEDYEAFKRDVIGDPSRRMISEKMEGVLSAALAQSVATGEPWRLIGNAIPMARMLVPDLVGKGYLPDPSNDENALDAAKRIAWLGKHELPFYTDTWDGYPAAREDFYKLCREAGASDLLVLTGDSHSFWANRLFDGEGRQMGLEIGTSGISSPGDFVESGFDKETAETLDRAFAEELDEVLWTDNFHQGYVRLDLARDEAQAVYIAVDNLLTPEFKTITLRTDRIAKKGGTVDYV
ncbi:MAG: alkaline phosphatase D family protein [Caulobacterales bacterium]|nr:alkaline phosphatase D family protein [Caulobacterales bacterium]